jgi:hypothetical protein
MSLKVTARLVLLASLATATWLTACSSSTPTGPSSSSLARLFDSAYVADTSGGHSFALRAQIEQVAALVADEGTTPVTVHLTTATGTLSMQMMALTFYDTTTTGTLADSDAIVIGWTSDYNQYVALSYTLTTGAGQAAQNIRVAGRLAGLILHTTRIAHADAPLNSSDAIGTGFVVQGDSVAQSDSTAGNISWAPADGHCSWQHVTIPQGGPDSTLACSRATVTTNFSLFFPNQPGVDASLTVVTMPSTALPAVRLVGLN